MLRWLQEEWPLLIVVPASLRLVWAEELEKWLPHLRPSSIHVIEGKEHRVAQVHDDLCFALHPSGPGGH
jgi:SNF2 family DNA or RNA helicase